MNGTLSPPPQQQQQPRDKNDTTANKSTANPNRILLSQFRLRCFPWISTSQHEFDIGNVGMGKSIHNRQPITPVGFKQWYVIPSIRFCTN
jgi:hypothetical protein